MDLPMKTQAAVQELAASCRIEPDDVVRLAVEFAYLFRGPFTEFVRGEITDVYGRERVPPS